MEIWISTIASVVGVTLVFFWPQIKYFLYWLKGSRETYYLDQDGAVKSSARKLRTPIDRVGTGMANPNQGVIEISRGWFRRPSAIYGDFHVSRWKFVSDGTLVGLRDGRSLSIVAALRLINTYSSLHAMLNRILELERQAESLEDKLAWSESHRKTWLASLEALRQEIESDRQFYRSKAAQDIRFRVEKIMTHAKGLDQIPNDDNVLAIKRLWINSARPFSNLGV